ncbi:hypothetical protein [Alteromonas sp. CYL-A6]|uniref:hypothetical protein n=1 Tax=Alteromonas nitratireducens TaxID=3390813 RepID=UPI0034B72E2D
MLLDSKSKPNKPSGAEEKLSQIPTMVSEISRKISNYRQSYRELVKDAESFFENYLTDYKQITLLKHKVKTYQDQIDFIEKYRKEKGKYPTIKGQPSAQRYMARLVAQQASSDNELKAMEERLRIESNKRYEHLDHLTDHMLDLLNGERIFSQFLGTIALSTPSPQEKVRHIRNEKYKPIYVTALAIALFEEVRTTHQFSNKFLNDELAKVFSDGKTYSLMADKTGAEENASAGPEPMPSDIKMAYRERILRPIAKAALLQSIGMHSPEANNVLGHDRYRKLSHEERTRLLDIVDKKTSDYLKLGIGIPSVRFNTKEQRDAFVSEEKRQLVFMLKILKSVKVSQDELGDLLRIPMTYASFLLSTKEEFDYRQIYRAYDILDQGRLENTYKAEYVKAFLKMVGRFPLGAGIYVIQQDSGEIERAIVSSLYPADPDEPICKIITRRQIQFLSQAEVIISKGSNLFFKESRDNSHYEAEFFDARYKNEFTWNATDVWENQVPAIEFWKRDGTRKYNGIYNPDSY